MAPDLDSVLECLKPYPGERQDSLWALLRRGDDPGTALEIVGGVRPDDATYCANLLALLDESEADEVLVVVPRHRGVALDADRAMCRRLRRGCAGLRVRFEGMVVVGPSGWCWVDGGAEPVEGAVSA
jgi:hypothetical protein